MPSNPPSGVPRAYPRLAYDDLNAAVPWLERAFGFRERKRARLSNETGEISLTELEVGPDGLVMLSRTGNHDLKSPERLGGRSGMTMVYVDDVEAHLECALAAGARVVMGLSEQPWGDRRYEALDLEGQRWYFAQHVRDVDPSEWQPR
jgi:uncharacterized glyoxalase superfamily protein PhnB